MGARYRARAVLAIGPLVLGGCSAEPPPIASPHASPTFEATAPAEPSPSASPSPPPTPFPVRESEAADALFRRPDSCNNPEIGYTVTFPDDWYTNTAIGEQAACSWFTPDFFEVDVPGGTPDEIWISIGMIEGIFGYNTLTPTESSEEIEIDGHAGHRAEYRTLDDIGDTDSDHLTYHYVIPFDTTGPTLVAATDVDMADDYSWPRRCSIGSWRRWTSIPSLPRCRPSRTSRRDRRSAATRSGRRTPMARSGSRSRPIRIAIEPARRSAWRQR